MAARDEKKKKRKKKKSKKKRKRKQTEEEEEEDKPQWEVAQEAPRKKLPAQRCPGQMKRLTKLGK